MALDFDIVVIGGGHAGVEAAWAASGLSRATALVTLDASVIAQMSCNPAIGGVGKGQIVREIDAMGGLMGLAADATGIQFRMLNLSKGPAVWGPRCQSDRHAYAAWAQRALGERKNLTIIEGEATDVIVEDARVVGVKVRQHPQANSALEGGTDRESIDLRCRAAIVTAGTFLNGVMHLGERTWAGGRYDEPAANGLTASLAALGLEFGRLKTGTCARLDAATIDYDKCVRQDGDAKPAPFSFMTARLNVEQIPCWITWTNRDVHDAIRANFHRAPMYTGQIQSTGPRYCPSIETKIDRFADKDRHQIFLEREGRTTDWVYCNGISTSLPPDVQDFMVHHIEGLERARIIRYGYAIEYDYFPPTQLAATLETKGVLGLYLAGQVNGTTGYEEAAAQGLLAGLNAALTLRGDRPLVLRRDQAYIGVMIDDLVTKGVSEPYRMFTSRAEHRLSLRADNADRRLTPVARDAGLVDDARWARYQAARQVVSTAEALLRSTRAAGKSLWETLRRPDMNLAGVLALSGADVQAKFSQLLAEQPDAVNSLAIDGRYEGYREKEASALRHMQDLDRKLLPSDIDYHAISHLRHEAREKLSACRPHSLGQALRISGITPADVTVLAVHLMGRNVKMDNL